MDKVFERLTELSLPYVSVRDGNDTIIVFAVGYTPFEYREDELEIGAFYIASNKAYFLSKELALLAGENAVANPKLDYKSIAEKGGLGVRGYNDLIYTQKFGSLCALGALKIIGEVRENHLKKPILECEGCKHCIKICPNEALTGGFNYPLCIRQQMDNDISDKVQAKLAKSILGCNVCSRGCIQNDAKTIRPPEELAKLLKIEVFFENALKGREGFSKLANWVGVNMVRPARMLTLAVYALQNINGDYDVWLDKLENYPDERVVRAVKYVKDKKGHRSTN